MRFAHLKEQREADPLVVGHVSSLVLLVVCAAMMEHDTWPETRVRHAPGHDPRVGHVPAHVQREGPWYRVGGVDPAVQVEHVVRDVLE